MGAARARFITFEGGEGGGKSTQVGRLAEDLRGLGIDVLATREPGGSPAAEEIRALLVSGAVERWDPLSETVLHYVARRDHLRSSVLPALASGRWVVSDRYADSTMAYQGFGHRLGAEAIRRVHELVLSDLDPASTTPDLTLILDLPAEMGLARAGARPAGGEARYETMTVAFHERLRHGFLEIAAEEPQRCIVVDASQAVDQVAADVRAAVASRFDLEFA